VNTEGVRFDVGGPGGIGVAGWIFAVMMVGPLVLSLLLVVTARWWHE